MNLPDRNGETFSDVGRAASRGRRSRDEDRDGGGDAGDHQGRHGKREANHDSGHTLHVGRGSAKCSLSDWVL